jgi:hypothetical protein
MRTYSKEWRTQINAGNLSTLQLSGNYLLSPFRQCLFGVGAASDGTIRAGTSGAPRPYPLIQQVRRDPPIVTETARAPGALRR